MGWKNDPWFCIDTETTGPDPATAKIVELGAVLFVGGRVIKRLGMLVDPGEPIPEEATKIHGISDDDVRGKPTIDDIRDRFLEHVKKASVLVGYNWPYDAAIINRQMGEPWREARIDKVVIDPLIVIRFDEVGRWWKGKGRHKLVNVAKRFGITPPGGHAHRASADATTTCLVLRELLRWLPDSGADANHLIRKQREKQDADFQQWKARQPKQ